MAETSDRDKDFRTLCTLALINSKHAHYLWSLKRLVKEDLLREGTKHNMNIMCYHECCVLNHAAAAGTQRADVESAEAVVIDWYIGLLLLRLGASSRLHLQPRPHWRACEDQGFCV
jgi:hypothetical protein